MANYPQLDDCSGVWTLKEVNNAVMGGYCRNAAGEEVDFDQDAAATYIWTKKID